VKQKTATKKKKGKQKWQLEKEITRAVAMKANTNITAGSPSSS
jgi:hypothetical protein